MKTHLSLLTIMAIIGLAQAGNVQAGDVMTEAQMDQVTAGQGTIIIDGTSVTLYQGTTIIDGTSVTLPAGLYRGTIIIDGTSVTLPAGLIIDVRDGVTYTTSGIVLRQAGPTVVTIPIP